MSSNNGWRYSDDSLDNKPSDMGFGSDNGFTLSNLYLVFKSNVSYTATFNSNGGTQRVGDITAPGGKLTLPDAPGTNGNLTFAGWKNDTTGTVYDAGAEVTITANTNFTAQWVTETVTLTFSTNGAPNSISTPTAITGEKGATKTLPTITTDYTSNGVTYTFLGWSTNENAWKYSADTNIVFGYQSAVVYKGGAQYELTQTETLYAVWGPLEVDSTFYIRLKNTAIAEPTKSKAAEYTGGLTLPNAIKVGKFYVNTTTGVTDNLNHWPTLAQVADMVNASKKAIGFSVEVKNGKLLVASIINDKTNKENYNVPDPSETTTEVYVRWYVMKTAYQGNMLTTTDLVLGNYSDYGKDAYITPTQWHVDGALMLSSKLNLDYGDGVEVDGLVSNMPSTSQWNKNAEVKAGNSEGDNNNVMVPVRSDGYTFNGWAEYRKDGEGNYTVETGRVYRSGETFNITEDTKLVAQWAKKGYTLTINKVDGLGKALRGATFTVTDTDTGSPLALTAIAGTSFTATYETETTYKVHEEAPQYYTGISDFYFKVTINNEVPTVTYLDAEGNTIDTLTNVAKATANGGGVTFTVTNYAYFYVFHSSTGKVDPVKISTDSDDVGWNDDKSAYDLTKHLTKTAGEYDYLYGGYFRDYGGKGNYAGDGVAPTFGFVPYTGNQTNYWTSAYTEDGRSMVPQAGTTYYLKEVPKSYLNPAIYVVYDTHNKDSIVRQYLMTATDDSNYLDVGLNVKGTKNVSTKTLSTIRYKQVNVSGALKNETLLTKGSIVNGEVLNVTNPEDVFTSTNGGWLAITEALYDKYIASGSIFDFTPYYTTLDGVTVTASMKMKVYLRQAFFNEDNPWQKNGITKVGLPMHISLS